MDGQLADRQKETAPGRETDVGRDPKASPAVTVSDTKSSVHPLGQIQSQRPGVTAAVCLQGCMFCLSIENWTRNLTQFIQGITQERKKKCFAILQPDKRGKESTDAKKG